MLDIVRKKIPGSGMQERIRTHKCDESAINLNDRVDFILAFYMIHELASPDNTLSEFKTLLKPGGRILIIEPKFHVRKGAFHIMISRLEKAGFIIIERPKYFMSRAILVSTK
jgi:ubiquinone/menaquinone biosynthesis C-methylase UbiE